MPVPDQICNALLGDFSQALLAEVGEFGRQAPALSSVGAKPFTTGTVQWHSWTIGSGKRSLRAKFEVPSHMASEQE
jgi:hypothetical protein